MVFTARDYATGGAAGGGARLPVSPNMKPTNDAWAEFARSPRVKTNRLEAHDVVFYEGDPADRVYEMIEGVAMLYKLLPDGRRQVVEIIGPNDVFGMLASKLYDCNAETLAPSIVRVFERRDAENSLAAQQQLTQRILKQVETLHNHAVLLGRKSAYERVSTFLMYLIPGRGMTDCPGPSGPKDDSTIPLSMTRQEIADYLGLTIETVSRVISDMKRRGLLTIERQDQIRVTNVCGLCHLTGTH